MLKKTKLNGEISYKNDLPYILAFVIPVIIMTGIFIGREVFPFGDMMYLRSDCYHQYAPFYQELYRKLSSGGSLTYSWEIGMGVNFTSLYAYYLASPINLLIGLLPSGCIIEVIGTFIILKIALSCTTCTYYLSKHFKTNSMITAAFGLFYGFSSYFAAFSWNIMWLDCMILLPLIILGLERLVKENKCFLYCISLGLAIFSNYYIAIMLCIYCVIYFVYLIFTHNKKITSYFVAKRFLNFFIYSLIAGGLAACLLLPEIYTLGLSASGDFNFPDTLTNYFSILQMLSRNVMNMYASIFDAHSPNLYFSVCSYLLIPLYCLCSPVPKKEKLGKAAIAIFFLFSFNLNIPNYIWHGLHFPNSLPCRESFIFIFLLITMCFEAAMHYKEFTDKQIFGAFAGSIALLLVIEQLFVGTNVFDETDKPYTFEMIYLSMLFILFYLAIMVLARRNTVKKGFIIYLVFIVAIAEVAINTDETGYSTISRSYYLSDNDSLKSLLGKAKDADDSLFYRTEKLDRITKNDAAWVGYYGVSTFSSTANASITEVLGRLGFEKSTNAYSSYGLTPVTADMLSIKYYIANTVTPDTEYMSLYLSDSDRSRYLYKNNYWLPLGYMVDSNFIESWNVTGNNPFAVQNSYIDAALGKESEEKVFNQLEAVCVGSDVEITVPKANHVYVYVTSYVSSINVSAYSDTDTSFVYSNSFSGLKHRQIVDLGEMPDNTTITVTTGDEISSLQLYAYSYDGNLYSKIHEQLNKEVFNITNFEDTNIKGNVTTQNGGLLFTSINYDEGWSVYIDGKKSKIQSINGAFIGVDIPSGTHDIEFKFTPKGLIPGCIISFISLAILITLIFLDYHKKKNKAKLKKEEAVNDDTDVIYEEVKEETESEELLTD